jgi:tetratricopeptide (TPR) repeat protein
MIRWLTIGLLAAACATPDAVVLAPDLAGYSRELDGLDSRIEAANALVGSDWTASGRVASLRLERARLAGGYDDYDHALDALDHAFALAPEGSGPLTTRAQVHASLHRLGPALHDLAVARSRILLDDRTVARMDLLAGDLAWQGGDYDAGMAIVADVDTRLASFGSAASVAHQAWHTLDDPAAETAFDRAEAHLIGDAPVARAWIHLQRGLLDLDRGDPDGALGHYLRADAAVPGWWLVHEHVAEALVLTGRSAQAEGIYLDVVERTDSPEFMDALAELALARGDAAEAERWIAGAELRYEDQLARYPEAAAGHALDHWLVFGPPERAVELARANLTARPSAEARGKLAAALLQVGDVDEAVDHIDAALATPWRNGDLLATAAAVYGAAGIDRPAR